MKDRIKGFRSMEMRGNRDKLTLEENICQGLAGWNWLHAFHLNYWDERHRSRSNVNWKQNEVLVIIRHPTLYHRSIITPLWYSCQWVDLSKNPMLWYIHIRVQWIGCEKRCHHYLSATCLHTFQESIFKLKLTISFNILFWYRTSCPISIVSWKGKWVG